MWKLMEVEENISISLTESFAMQPAAAVSGLYFAGKCSQYFAVGKITQDQVVSYATRKKIPIETAQKWLSPMLKYAPRVMFGLIHSDSTCFLSKWLSGMQLL